MYSLDVISSVIVLAFTKRSPNTSPNTHHMKTQRVSLSYSLSTLLKGETRELFDKITQWKKHQRTAILVLCLRVLAISLADYKSWGSGRHTPPGGAGGTSRAGWAPWLRSAAVPSEAPRRDKKLTSSPSQSLLAC